jgi:hypothetical protein
MLNVIPKNATPYPNYMNANVIPENVTPYPKHMNAKCNSRERHPLP